MNSHFKSLIVMIGSVERLTIVDIYLLPSEAHWICYKAVKANEALPRKPCLCGQKERFEAV